MSRLWSVLLWSVIAAAFIGPGTVTVAASAGAGFGYALLWALLLSTVACLLLQEAAARLTVVSGLDLGQALRAQYRGGVSGAIVLLLVLAAIVLGCAAYEVGNILGGVAGAVLGIELEPRTLTLLSGLAAAGVLAPGRTRLAARLLGLLVAVMGVAFLFTAWHLAPSAGALLRGALVPSFPSGSGLLVLGLVGTTVVPYNLFLGSGLAAGQSLSELRFGLSVAVLCGGVVSMGILVVGTAVEGPFGFTELADVLAARLGGWARTLFASGLFAAGLSSAVTAPLAAAVTARSLFGGREPQRWGEHSWRFRGVWLFVLATGVGFGLAGVRPIPAILIAQAANGVLLPLVAVFLLLAVNDRELMGARGLNGPLANAALIAVVAATLVLGLANVGKAFSAAAGLPRPSEPILLGGAAILAAAIAWPVTRRIKRRRTQGSDRGV